MKYEWETKTSAQAKYVSQQHNYKKDDWCKNIGWLLFINDVVLKTLIFFHYADCET